MKIKVTRPDGTIIEAEGTVEECERLVSGPPAKSSSEELLEFLKQIKPETQPDLPFVPYVPVPYYPPVMPWDPSVPSLPWSPEYPYRVGPYVRWGWTTDRITLGDNTQGVTVTCVDDVPMTSGYVLLSSISSDNISYT